MASLTTILDMVKVISFAVQEGKVAIHCHAGLGRTGLQNQPLGLAQLLICHCKIITCVFIFPHHVGVLFACYLVFTCRMSADQAILFVRAKRTNSIQTRGQLLCVREFAQFLVPLRNVFSCAEPKASAVTLSQYLTRQRHLLHGYEARQMKNVPKIVQLVCSLLINIAADRQAVVKKEWFEIPDLTAEVEKTVSQQALQQLGKEMRVKGIPVPVFSAQTLSPPAVLSTTLHDQPLASDNELDPLWKRHNVESSLRCSLSNNRNLSYSDSVLYKLEIQEHRIEKMKGNNPIKSDIKYSLSQSSVTVWDSHRLSDPTPQNIISSIPDSNTEEKQDTRLDFIKQPLCKDNQSWFLNLAEQPSLSASSAKNKLITSEEQSGVDVLVGGADQGNSTKPPFVTLQSDLSPESRCLHVAKALAWDLIDLDVSSKVSLWQVEYSI